ncbi:hypothetical protein VspSTUT16_25700 [Vibrio sp. STUT-A16]|nr:hypothetical protein VspSTUT16_25700 [Vibrio sp. STUT-A16]
MDATSKSDGETYHWATKQPAHDRADRASIGNSVVDMQTEIGAENTKAREEYVTN